MNTKSRKAIDYDWPIFVEATRARLEVGAVEYGDKSLELPAEQLIAEIEQELHDVMGWGFLAYRGLQKIKADIARLRSKTDAVDNAGAVGSAATPSGQLP
jgi:hypothetical protein